MSRNRERKTREKNRQYDYRETYSRISSESLSPDRSRSPLEKHKKELNYRDKDTVHENTHENNILAIFGLNLYAKEADLHKIYSHFGSIRCKIIINHRTGRSKGYGFVYFKTKEEATYAKDATKNIKILDKEIRIDYSKERNKRFSSSRHKHYRTIYRSPVSRRDYYRNKSYSSRSSENSTRSLFKRSRNS